MKNKKECFILLAFFLLIMILYMIDIKVPCIFHKITGFYCPGCGITRMFVEIFRLRFYEAFYYNELCFSYLILFIIYLLYYLISKLLNIKVIKISNKFYYVLIVITVLYGVLRNIPGFEILKP